jgi:hypothetical protein
MAVPDLGGVVLTGWRSFSVYFEALNRKAKQVKTSAPVIKKPFFISRLFGKTRQMLFRYFMHQNINS